MLGDLSDCPFGENICWSSRLSSLGEEKLSILRGISMMILSRVLREVDAAPCSNALHQLSSKVSLDLSLLYSNIEGLECFS